MNSRSLWFLLLVFFIAWSLWELNPPTPRDLVAEFQNRAINKDATFTNLLNQALKLEKEFPQRQYGNLWQAATNTLTGTNTLATYFPSIPLKGEANPNRVVLNQLQRDTAGRIKLGLDLQGGTSFVVGMDTNALHKTEDKERVLSQAVEVLRKRVDKFGVAEPVIQPAGLDRILIQLPGLSEADKESARNQIQKAAFLEFRLVHPESDKLLAEDLVEPGYEKLTEQDVLPDGTKRIRTYLVKKKAERGLTGKFIESAMAVRDPVTGNPQISFTFNNDGAQLFGEITKENIGHQLAIVLDGELYSAPVIQSEIRKHGQISGSFTLKAAIELANVLENPLEAPVKILEERSVEPSLGKDSIASGIKASIIGLLAVVVFMLVYYMLAGLVANAALVLNVIILLGVMCSFGTTLTMPGIAGILLTIGMAVDANVLIYERIREESEAGKSMRGALAAGYDKAFGTIFDSNLTTLISSVILIFLGTGSVKGFGVTLTIGVAVSMFTSLVGTRLIFDFLLARGWLKSLPMLHLIRTKNIDFIRWAKPAFVTSWLVIFIGCGYGIYRGKDVLGVDFAGGDSMTFGFKQQVEVEKVREAIAQLKLSEPQIQYQKDPVNNRQTLQVLTEYESGPKVEAQLKKAFPQAEFNVVGTDRVGPSVGREIQQSALIASFLAMFGILIYVAFRYEFSFAVGAVVALFHDVFMTLGWFFLTGRQLNAPIVAAILTIIGFSINDTIVIFDRIREDLKLGVRGSFKELINIALNQTLSRTIITSGTVFLATMSLYLFGGGVINDFAFCFLVGILTGTYSSIYIASALVLWWHKGQRPHIGSSPNTVIIEQAAPTKI